MRLIVTVRQATDKLKEAKKDPENSHQHFQTCLDDMIRKIQEAPKNLKTFRIQQARHRNNLLVSKPAKNPEIGAIRGVIGIIQAGAAIANIFNEPGVDTKSFMTSMMKIAGVFQRELKSHLPAESVAKATVAQSCARENTAEVEAQTTTAVAAS